MPLKRYANALPLPDSYRRALAAGKVASTSRLYIYAAVLAKRAVPKCARVNCAANDLARGDEWWIEREREREL